MSRINRKHTRNIERHRRNKGPELLSRAADNKLQEKAEYLVNGLADATMKNGDVAAATLLIDLAERADLVADPSTLERVLTLAEKWASEPQVVAIDIVRPGLNGGAKQLQLTDGTPAGACAEEEGQEREGESDSGPRPGTATHDPTEILEAIYE